MGENAEKILFGHRAATGGGVRNGAEPFKKTKKKPGRVLKKKKSSQKPCWSIKADRTVKGRKNARPRVGEGGGVKKQNSA